MSDPYQLESALDGFVLVDGIAVPARLVLSPTGLLLRDEEGREHMLPWRRAKLERRQSDGAVLLRTKAGVAGCADPDFLRAIEAAAGNEMGDAIARFAGERTGSFMSSWFGCLVFFGLLAALVLSIPGCIRRGVDAAVDAAPFSVDESIGEAAQANTDVGSEVEDEVVVGAMDAIVDRLARAATELEDRPEVDWQVRVVENDTVNAFALPGGYITVFTGLIDAAETPEMVAGVLAHEMAHVTERHGLRRVGQSLGVFAAIQLVLGGTGGLVEEAIAMMGVNAYSREHETEADVVGTRILHLARIDPAALGDFFQLLHDEYGDVPSSLAWMSTHPQHLVRIAAIAAEAEALGLVEWEPVQVDWAAVKEHLD